MDLDHSDTSSLSPDKEGNGTIVVPDAQSEVCSSLKSAPVAEILRDTEPVPRITLRDAVDVKEPDTNTSEPAKQRSDTESIDVSISDATSTQRVSDAPGSVDGNSQHSEADVTDSTSDENSDNESNEGSSGSESDEGISDEPLFKYTRLTQLPHAFFQREGVSAVFVSDDLIALGMHSGVLHLARRDFSEIRTSRLHRSSIMDIDSDGTYVATASMDGTVVISAIFNAQDTQGFNFRRPVHAVSLDPNYKVTRSFLTGGTAGAVTRSDKGWLKNRSDTVLHTSLSTISATKWVGDRIMWCTGDGITIYDTVAGGIVHHASRLPNSSLGELYRPRFNIHGDRVYVAWASTIWILDLDNAATERVISVPWLISGLAPVGEDSLLLLCAEQGRAPEVRLYNFVDEVENYVDELALQGFEKLTPNDFFMASASDKSFYIISAKDGVRMQWRDQQDHVDWLLEHGRYLEAYHASKNIRDYESGGDSEGARLSIAGRAANSLIDAGQWAEAAHLLSEALPPSKDQWKYWAAKFLANREYVALGDNLPHTELDGVHTKVLQWVLEHDFSRMVHYLNSWSLSLFDATVITQELEAKSDLRLKRELAKLYSAQSDFVGAVRSYLLVNSREAFELVDRYHLWNDFLTRLPEVLRSGIDVSLAPVAGSANSEKREVLANEKSENGDAVLNERLDMLVKRRAEVSPGAIIKQLSRSDESWILFLYLQRLNSEDEYLVKDYSDLLVELYANYGRDLLLSFLMRSNTYNLSKAIAICEKQGYTNELVFLFGKVGQTQKALDLIVRELQDAKRAIDFAVAQGDEDLWNRLVDYAKTRPDFVLQLLRTHQVRPARVLAAVPSSLAIPGLRDALVGVFLDQNALLNLNDGTLSIVKSEAKTYLRLLQHARTHGYSIDPELTSVDWTYSALFDDDNAPVDTPLTRSVPIEPETGLNWFPSKVRRLGWILQRLRG